MKFGQGESLRQPSGHVLGGDVAWVPLHPFIASIHPSSIPLLARALTFHFGSTLPPLLAQVIQVGLLLLQW